MSEPSPDPVELLTELVRIPSPSGHEGPAVSFLVSWARRAGFRAHRDGAGNFVAELGDGPITHVLLGHIDTVPGEIPVRIEAGELWGRGAADAKGPLACFLAASARIGAVAGHRLVVIGAVEEETASSKGAWFVRDRYAPLNTLIGEPSGASAITLGYKGRLFAQLELEAPRAHSSIPMPTPIERAASWWEAVRDYCEAQNGGRSAFDSLQPTLERIEGGGTPFALSARARIGFRLPLGSDVRALKEQLIESAGADAARALRFEGEVPAFKAGKSTAVVRALLASMREQGMTPVFKVKTGTADMNVVGPTWGPSIAAYGPGDSSLDHTPEERIALGEYRRGIDVLEGALRRLLL